MRNCALCLCCLTRIGKIFLLQKLLRADACVQLRNHVVQTVHDVSGFLQCTRLCRLKPSLLCILKCSLRSALGLFPFLKDILYCDLSGDLTLKFGLFIDHKAHLSIVLLTEELLEIKLERTVDLLICLDMIVCRLFLLLELQIWDVVTNDFLDIVNGIVDGRLLCCIDDLLHALCDLLLEIDGIKTLRRNRYLRNLDRIVYIFPGTLHLICTDGRDAFLCQTELAVLLLLCPGKRLVEHLKLQRALHIRSVAKPENQLITCLHALLTLVRLMIKVRKLECPFLGILFLFEFFENVDQLGNIRAAFLLNLVAQYIPQIVMRCDLHKLLIILLRSIEVLHLDCDLCQTVDDHTPDRGTVIRAEQDLLALLITSDLLVNLSDTNQRIYILDLVPADGIRKLRGCGVIALRTKRFHLIYF